jgi:sugar transferase (PEP-CTERM/EpsH1 system associated)
LTVDPAPRAASSAALPPLVLHVVYRFDVGGLENGVVNLINHMPAEAYRHAVLSLTEATDFRKRICKESVPVLTLHKPPGHGFWQYPALFRIFRSMRPAVVHTRNLAALEAVVPAWAAGVGARVHGEHGREGRDLGQDTSRYDRLRRLYRPFVSHYVALSQDLASYLETSVHVRDSRLSQIYNGVDADLFSPSTEPNALSADWPFDPQRHWVVGTVGRMQEVKDQTNLARAFVRALEIAPELRPRLRLAMVGDGPLRARAMDIVQAAGLRDSCWFPGERSDVASLMGGLQCFALPSRSEGVSNVVLEAMACALPVVATAVGGNPELVKPGETGVLVPPSDSDALARAIVELASDPARARALGRAGRAEVECRFSLRSMVAAYQGLYDRLLGIHAGH